MADVGRMYFAPKAPVTPNTAPKRSPLPVNLVEILETGQIKGIGEAEHLHRRFVEFTR